MQDEATDKTERLLKRDAARRVAIQNRTRRQAYEECAAIADNWNIGRKDRVTETSITHAIRAKLEAMP